MSKTRKGDPSLKKKYIALASTILLLSPVFGANQVQALSLDELNREKEQLQEQSEDVQNQIHEKESSLNQLEEEKNNLQTRVTELQNNIDELLEQLAEQEAKLEEIHNKIVALQERIEELQLIIEQRTEKLNNQARTIQTEASMTDLVTIIMNAESLTDMIGKVSIVNRLIQANKDIVVQQEADKKEVEDTKVAVEIEKAEAEQLRQEIIVSKNNIVAQQEELKVQIGFVIENMELTESEKNDLEATRSSLASKTEAINKDIAAEQQRLEEERIAREKAEADRIAREKAEADRIAREKEAANNLVASTNNSTSTVPATNSSGFIRPASGYNSSPYGMRINPVDGVYRMHRGMDIAGGGPILATQSGVVESAGYDSIYGYHVVVNHGMINGVEVKSKYAHMIPGLFVAPGQHVGQGQQLGIMGTTGQSTGVHLHFEIFENGSQVNPLKYVSL